MWEPGLPAMAVGQSLRMWRMYRYRRQASSHSRGGCREERALTGVNAGQKCGSGLARESGGSVAWVWLMYRYLRQASSHIGDLCCLQIDGSRTDRVEHPPQHGITPRQLVDTHKLIRLMPLVHAPRPAYHGGDAHCIEQATLGAKGHGAELT